MKKFSFFLVIFFCVSFLASCHDTKSTFNTEEATPEKLVVFAVGDLMMTNYGEEFYSSRYNVGEFSSLSEKWGPEAYIFYDAMNEFQKQTGIEIELYFFIQTKDLLAALKENINNGKCPDIIVGSYTAQDYCLYSYFEENYFADLKPYFDEDELYTSGQYISTVLEAGLIGDRQLIFPLTYNMNVLFSSKESMQRHDLWISEDMTYKDLITLFIENWQQNNRDSNELLMMQFASSQKIYPYGLFQSASGENIVDYDTGKISLDEEYFYELARLYESYIHNDYNMTKEELVILADDNYGRLPYDESKYSQIKTTVLSEEKSLDLFEALYERVGYFSEGGNESAYSHSFISQTYYYESRYKDAQENFVCIGIPSRKYVDGYTAQVTTYGAVVSNSPYTKYGYEFLKALADSDPFMYLDMTVNKTNTINRIEELTTLYYDLNPNLGLFPPEMDEKVNWLDDSYKISPLTEDTKNYLIYLIDNIANAKLPEGILNEIIASEISEYIYGNTKTLEEAYVKASQQLELQGFIN